MGIKKRSDHDLEVAECLSGAHNRCASASKIEGVLGIYDLQLWKVVGKHWRNGGRVKGNIPKLRKQLLLRILFYQLI